MRVLLVPVGNGISLDAVDGLAASLAQRTGFSCRTCVERMDTGVSYSQDRGQYYSTAILQQLVHSFGHRPTERVLGVTDLDLFVPVLQFVFGEAQLQGTAAVISMHRLRQEFYGEPPDERLAADRLLKEALHELGHTFGLKHCADWDCVMSASHSIERVDVRSSWFCGVCRPRLPLGGSR